MKLFPPMSSMVPAALLALLVAAAPSGADTARAQAPAGAARDAVVTAAEAIFPPTLRVGLVPPPDFILSPMLPGFRHSEARAEIRLSELPDYAFAAIEKQIESELARQPSTVERREIKARPGMKAILVRAQQSSPQGPVIQWTMVANDAKVTAVVTALIPEAIAEVAPEPALMASFESLVIRERVPQEEQLEALPFSMRDLAGYRIIRVQPGVAVMLTEGPEDAINENQQPVLLVSIAPAPTMPRPEERDGFARRLVADTPGLKDLRVRRSEPMRVAGQQGHEMLLEGKDAAGEKDVNMVQWLRFGAGTILRIVGIVRKEGWEDHYSRFRAVRDGIGPR